MKLLRKFAWWTFFWAMVFGSLWFIWIYQQIRKGEVQDHAAPADAIAVFGAAEYNGHPSPVLKARLDHALELYRLDFAPIIITLGGGNDPNLGEEPRFSEGEVERDYLLSHGVPDASIIPETVSRDTEQSVQHLAVIARANQFQKIIVVSDGTHLFRITQLCHAQGLYVLASPRAVGRPLGAWDQVQRYAHEMISYTLWRLNLH